MKSFSLLLLIISVVSLAGCVFATEGFPTMKVEGHLTGRAGDNGTEKTVIVSFCHRREGAKPVIADADGKFLLDLGYVHGGFLFILPPLGNIPRQTPAPPDVCVSFPNTSGQHYVINLARERVLWKAFDQTGREETAHITLPSLVRVDLEELNRRGALNDWLLRLDFVGVTVNK